jgi:hypothetical protein
MRGYAIGSLTVVMLAVAGCSSPVAELDEVPLDRYLEGSWSCLLQDGFFVADGTATLWLDFDGEKVTLSEPERPEAAGAMSYEIADGRIHLSAPEADFDYTLTVAETLSVHDEVELDIGDDEPLIATVVDTGFEIRDRYRVGITCDRR